MKVKLFTLAFSEPLGGFDAEEMERFVDEKEVLSVTEHFFKHGHRPYWSILLSYDETTPTARQKGTPVLSPATKALYDALKAWRLERAKKERFPAYIILHDRQILEIVRTVPESITALTKIRGIGENKSRDYGPDILEVIKKWQNESHLPTT